MKDKLGPGRIISQLQGLALSPLSSKKQLMRLQGRRSRVRIPGGLSFPSCIIAIRIGMGWVQSSFCCLVSLLPAGQ